MVIRGAGDPATLDSLVPEFMQAWRDPQARMAVVRSGERAPIDITKRRLIHQRDHWRCLWCGWSPFPEDILYPNRMLQLDHITPWSAGGNDRSDNIRSLCGDCNETRGNRRADIEVATVLPVVGWCSPCTCSYVEDDEVRPDVRPDAAITVYCGSCRRNSWTTNEWSIY